MKTNGNNLTSRMRIERGQRRPGRNDRPSRGGDTGGRKGEQGQALVETALAGVILIIILMGLLDLGRVYFTYLAMQNAVGEGAAYGLIHPTWWQGDDSLGDKYKPNPNNITYRTKNESPSALVDWSGTDVTIDSPFPTPGNPLTVTMAYEYDLITPVMQAVFGETIIVRATAIQIVMSSDLAMRDS